MLTTNIYDAKTHLSEYLDRLDEETEIIICRRNKPVAVLKPLPDTRSRRKIGGEKGILTIPDSFFDPLPEAVAEGFEGKYS
jgi:prevent-host-death family protein